MKNEKKVEKIMVKFSDFTYGVRMIMLIHRNKEGGKSNRPDRKAKRKISTNREEFREILSEFLELKEASKLPLRIYSSVNARNFEKGIREFKRLQLEADYKEIDVRYKFFLDIKNRFLSALMKPNSRDETYFLIDYDDTYSVKEIEGRLKELGVKILLRYKTKNGWHIITESFNPNEMGGIEIKKDALLLLDF